MTSMIESIDAMKIIRNELSDKKIGFVPTMGNLHEGHLTLVQQALCENDVTVVSIFVNPIQFDNAEDLQKYPRTFEADLAKLKSLKVDYVFAPLDEASFFPDEARYRIDETTHHASACGRARPGHLIGAMTICMKLFNLIRPDVAYFGEKDYQQLHLIKGMVKAFFMPIEIRAVSTVREASGLAMSSRNNRLSHTMREYASMFYALLNSGGSKESLCERLTDAGFKIDYVEDIGDRRLAAVWLEGIRLIDNVLLES